jgi:hypothetical protein
MKIVKLFFIFLFAFGLTACDNNEQQEEQDVTLTLIGDDIVRIEEGSEYEDMGILINGVEDRELGYYSNVNINRVGTYYIKYEYQGKEIIRTVEVIPGPKTELLTIIEEFAQATNYTYSLNLDVRFSRGGEDFHTFIYENYDVNGDYLFGTTNRTSYQMIEYTQQAYIYLDIANQVEEHYMFDDTSFWYQDRVHYPTPTTLVTDLFLDGIKSVTKEETDNQTIYTGFLNFEDYIFAYNSKINLIPDENFAYEVDDYITITITVESGHIVNIETDLLDVMKGALSEASNAEILEYTYEYTFDNYDEVDEIIIPEEGIQARRLVHPDFTGSGTQEDPFIILDFTQFLTIQDNLDKYFKLGADIDFGNNAWIPLGYYNRLYGQPYCFTGGLDGNGYTIQNMSVNGQLNISEYGLFTCIDGSTGGGIVTNLTFDNVNITLRETNISFTGGVLAGHITDGQVTNVTIRGSMRINITITDGFHLLSIGGLTGEISDDCTLIGNTYDMTITLQTNLPNTNYFIHEVAGTGYEYLTTYESTSTVTVEVIE